MPIWPSNLRITALESTVPITVPGAYSLPAPATSPPSWNPVGILPKAISSSIAICPPPVWFNDSKNGLPNWSTASLRITNSPGVSIAGTVSVFCLNPAIIISFYLGVEVIHDFDLVLVVEQIDSLIIL